MPKNVTYEYEVRGVGLFPIDMLRYDRATPATEQDSVKIGGSFREHLQARTVRLVSDYPPTSARWSSFGWQVEPDVKTRRKY